MPNTTYGTPFVASSDLVSAYPGVSSTLATRVDDISIKGNGLNDQTGVSYTLVLTDGGKTVTLSNASAVTVTIPTNTSVAFPLGTEINFVNKGAGTVTIQPTGGVTLNGGNLTLPQFAAVQLVKLDTNTWGQLDSVASTPGLVLISPTSIANSGGTASASGGAVTFTTVNSISLNGVFTSSNENYVIVLNFTRSGTGGNVTLRMRASGSDTTSGVYDYGIYYTYFGSASSGNNIGAAQTSFFIPPSSGAGAGTASIQVVKPQLAQRTQLMLSAVGEDNASLRLASVGGGTVVDTTQYDGFTLTSSTATMTGTVRVYGYRN